MEQVLELNRRVGLSSIWVRVTEARSDVPDETIQFEITSSTSYRAILPACICDRTPCLKTACSAHGHCHYGWHREHAEAKARKVLATYGTGMQGKSTLKALPNGETGRQVRNLSVKAWAETEWAQTMEQLVGDKP